jgi:hypothetical protein
MMTLLIRVDATTGDNPGQKAPGALGHLHSKTFLATQNAGRNTMSGVCYAQRTSEDRRRTVTRDGGGLLIAKDKRVSPSDINLMNSGELNELCTTLQLDTWGNKKERTDRLKLHFRGYTLAIVPISHFRAPFGRCAGWCGGDSNAPDVMHDAAHLGLAPITALGLRLTKKLVPVRPLVMKHISQLLGHMLQGQQTCAMKHQYPAVLPAAVAAVKSEVAQTMPALLTDSSVLLDVLAAFGDALARLIDNCYCPRAEACKPSHALRISVLCAVVFERLIDVIGENKKHAGKGTEKNLFNAHVSGLLLEVPWMCKIFGISELHTETGEQYFQLCNKEAANTKCDHVLALKRMLYRACIAHMHRQTSETQQQETLRMKSTTDRRRVFEKFITPDRDEDEDGPGRFDAKFVVSAAEIAKPAIALAFMFRNSDAHLATLGGEGSIYVEDEDEAYVEDPTTKLRTRSVTIHFDRFDRCASASRDWKRITDVAIIRAKALERFYSNINSCKKFRVPGNESAVMWLKVAKASAESEVEDGVMGSSSARDVLSGINEDRFVDRLAP